MRRAVKTAGRIQFTAVMYIRIELNMLIFNKHSCVQAVHEEKNYTVYTYITTSGGVFHSWEHRGHCNKRQVAGKCKGIKLVSRERQNKSRLVPKKLL